MARVIVDVMLKPEILDPQGRAVQGALARLGLDGVANVRQGKHFVIELDGEPDDESLDRLHALAGELLSNPVIEDFEMYLESDGGCDCGDEGCGSASLPLVAAEGDGGCCGGGACGCSHDAASHDTDVSDTVEA